MKTQFEDWDSCEEEEFIEEKLVKINDHCVTIKGNMQRTIERTVRMNKSLEEIYKKLLKMSSQIDSVEKGDSYSDPYAEPDPSSDPNPDPNPYPDPNPCSYPDPNLYPDPNSYPDPDRRIDRYPDSNPSLSPYSVSNPSLDPILSSDPDSKRNPKSVPSLNLELDSSYEFKIAMDVEAIEEAHFDNEGEHSIDENDEEKKKNDGSHSYSFGICSNSDLGEDDDERKKKKEEGLEGERKREITWNWSRFRSGTSWSDVKLLSNFSPQSSWSPLSPALPWLPPACLLPSFSLLSNEAQATKRPNAETLAQLECERTAIIIKPNYVRLIWPKLSPDPVILIWPKPVPKLIRNLLFALNPVSSPINRRSSDVCWRSLPPIFHYSSSKISSSVSGFKSTSTKIESVGEPPPWSLGLPSLFELHLPCLIMVARVVWFECPLSGNKRSKTAKNRKTTVFLTTITIRKAAEFGRLTYKKSQPQTKQVLEIFLSELGLWHISMDFLSGIHLEVAEKDDQQVMREGIGRNRNRWPSQKIDVGKEKNLMGRKLVFLAAPLHVSFAEIVKNIFVSKMHVAITKVRMGLTFGVDVEVVQDEQVSLNSIVGLFIAEKMMLEGVERQKVLALIDGGETRKLFGNEVDTGWKNRKPIRSIKEVKSMEVGWGQHLPKFFDQMWVSIKWLQGVSKVCMRHTDIVAKSRKARS